MAFEYDFDFEFTEKEKIMLELIKITPPKTNTISHAFAMLVDKQISAVINLIPNFVKVNPDIEDSWVENNAGIVHFRESLSELSTRLYTADSLAFKKLRREGKIDISQMIGVV